MLVENTHNYAVEGGVIISNCDALRYAFNEEIIAERGCAVAVYRPPVAPARRRSAIYA